MIGCVMPCALLLPVLLPCVHSAMCASCYVCMMLIPRHPHDTCTHVHNNNCTLPVLPLAAMRCVKAVAGAGWSTVTWIVVVESQA
jgi:hypothetical protein